LKASVECFIEIRQRTWVVTSFVLHHCNLILRIYLPNSRMSKVGILSKRGQERGSAGWRKEWARGGKAL